MKHLEDNKDLFIFKKAENNFNVSTKSYSSSKYLKRFFNKKINITFFIIFILFLLFIFLSMIFYPYSPNKAVGNSNLFSNLPNYFFPYKTERFNLNDYTYNLIKEANKVNSSVISKEIFISDQVSLTYNSYLLLEVVKKHNYVLFFGTNNLAISRFSNFVFSFGYSFLTLFLITFIQIFIGIFLGLIIGYFNNKKIPQISYLIFNSLSVIPFVILIILTFKITSFSLWKMFVFFSIFGFINSFYLTYNKTIEIKENEYLNAYKIGGSNNIRIIFKYIFPQVFFYQLSLFGENLIMNIIALCSLAFFDVEGFDNYLNIGNLFKQLIVDFDNLSYVIFVIVFTTSFICILKVLAINLYLAYDVKNK
ncbi:Oligopeptide transport system permease protein OppC [Mycoplasmopsis meleagridis]|uniref:Oligopeptide transport system permease protein OppC n=1 Tax=Mycoplasmopsis meleagridis ATCC 25294 TaxID=1264554 RepID=A0A0F5H0R3_9BACT|nr:ABC transporter permease subunit [Mycoplasmopsis meleagridis]KKB26793.1 Oligopeptide transport system permease protein OppC [Mycoplasmopsis meleagridis ATCC 25294]OAD18090.1 Oligopeptide transport system permease protein OppC [Mycoplasmopsis meleagridis]VEU77328.1 antimicrobial peptide ABC transporter permease SapC [Mycoplasmopsis meleagridis]